MTLDLACVRTAKWATADELVAAAQHDPGVISIMKYQYANMDSGKVFQRLLLCKDMLRTAKAAAGNRPCSVMVLQTLTGYQDVVHHSTTASGQFVDACLQAMKIHKMTYTFVEKGMGDKALKWFGKLHEVAQDMVKVAGSMEEQADNLLKTCTGALTQSQTDLTVSAEERRKIQATLDFASAQKAKFDAGLKNLKQQISEAKEEEASLAKKAGEQRDKAFALSMTTSIIGGISSCVNPLSKLGLGSAGPAQAGDGAGKQAAPPAGGDGGLAAAHAEQSRLKKEIATKKKEMKKAKGDDVKEITDEIDALEACVKEAKNAISQASALATAHAESLEAQESMAKAQRQNLQNSQREQSEELAKTVEEMKNMTVEKDNVAAAMKSLQMCVVTLGKVRTTFADVKMFWEQVSKHCEKLCKDSGPNGPICSMVEEMAKDPDVQMVLMDDFTDELASSAQSWAALGLQSHSAWVAMMEAKKGIDGVVNDIPVGDCSSLLADCLSKLDKELQDEMQSLQALGDA